MLLKKVGLPLRTTMKRQLFGVCKLKFNKQGGLCSHTYLLGKSILKERKKGRGSTPRNVLIATPFSLTIKVISAFLAPHWYQNIDEKVEALMSQPK